MIDALALIGADALPALHACGLTLEDQWQWIVQQAVQRTGVERAVVEAELRNAGHLPTNIELADDEICLAIIDGMVRHMDAVEVPHNCVAIQESYIDMARRVAGRVDRVSSGATLRDRALAEISFHHEVDAFVAARALRLLGRLGEGGGPAAVHGAGLFIATLSHTEH